MSRLRLQTLAILGSIVFVFGCNGSDSAPPEGIDAQDSPAAIGAPAGGDAEEVVIAVHPIDGSGVGGSAWITPAGRGVEITVLIEGTSQGIHQGHIHTGTCAERGRSLVPLQSLAADENGAGEATSLVELDAATVFNGQHIVVYHEPGGEPGRSIACAQIPARAL
jgi:hypothetical protein